MASIPTTNATIMYLNQNRNIQYNKDADLGSKFHMTQSVHLEVVIAARIKPKCSNATKKHFSIFARVSKKLLEIIE